MSITPPTDVLDRLFAPELRRPISRGTLQKRGPWWSVIVWRGPTQRRLNLHCTDQATAEHRRNQLVQIETDTERADLIARWKRKRRAAIRFRTDPERTDQP